MKNWKVIAGGFLSILFAYIYAYFTQTPSGFDMETFCMVIMIMAFIAGFFTLLCKLFSR